MNKFIFRICFFLIYALEVFFIKVLRQSHEKRYKLLLEHDVIGDLSDRNEDCDCFDICTVPKILT